MGVPSNTPIVKVILAYFPDWDPPSDRYEWNKTRCPFHAESRPSASVSYTKNAFNCHGCGMKGDVIGLIMRKEVIPFGEAVKRSEAILGGSYEPVPRKPARKPRRRAFGDSGPDGPERGESSRRVPPWLR